MTDPANNDQSRARDEIDTAIQRLVDHREKLTFHDLWNVCWKALPAKVTWTLVCVLAAALTGTFILGRKYPTKTSDPVPETSAQSTPEAPEEPSSRTLSVPEHALPFPDGELFTKGDPFPAGFNLLKPGDRVSLAKSTYPAPTGTMTHIHGEPYYKVEFSGGPFRSVAYRFLETKSDPQIGWISFQYQLDDETKQSEVKQAALSAFGSDGVTTGVTGTLTWDDVGGFRVRIDNLAYWVELRE